MSVDIRPIPRPGWDPLPFDGCVGVVGRVLVREETYFVAELRFSEHATIHEHPGDNDTIVVCLEGTGFTSVAGETAPSSRKASRLAGRQERPAPALDGRLDHADADGRALLARSGTRQIVRAADRPVLPKPRIRLARIRGGLPSTPALCRARVSLTRIADPAAFPACADPEHDARARRPPRRRCARPTAGSERSPTPSTAAPRPRSATGTRRTGRGSPPARPRRGTCRPIGRARGRRCRCRACRTRGSSGSSTV